MAKKWNAVTEIIKYSGDYKIYHYMALSHKDWELPNSHLCFRARMDIDRGLDFPIYTAIILFCFLVADDAFVVVQLLTDNS